MAKGDDVRRWRIEDKNRWLIFTRRGTDIEKYPAIKKHLEQWKARLTPGIPGGLVAAKVEIESASGAHDRRDSPGETRYHRGFIGLIAR